MKKNMVLKENVEWGLLYKNLCNKIVNSGKVVEESLREGILKGGVRGHESAKVHPGADPVVRTCVETGDRRGEESVSPAAGAPRSKDPVDIVSRPPPPTATDPATTYSTIRLTVRLS